jgi:bis(5'-nucleosyl)-tetraphosphatase (symmetrical)
MRTLVIGDVHGCKRELLDLLEKFRFEPGRDRLFQVGDLVSRGPDSLGALDIVERVGGQCVLGNHEAKLLQIWDKPFEQRTDEEKMLLMSLTDPNRVIQWIRGLPLWREVEGDGALPRYVIVHAGLEPNKTRMEDMAQRVLISIRTWDGVGENLDRESDPPWYDCIDWTLMRKVVVFGHWARRGLIIGPNIRGLDSGCVWGGALTGWCPEEDRFYQVSSHGPCLVART